MSRFRVVILGDGLTGWLAAAILALRLEGGAALTVAGTGQPDEHGLGPFGDAVIAPPEWQLGAVARALPDEWLRRHAAQSYALGIAFTGWGRAGAPWFLPFGETGAPAGGVAFPQIASRARQAGRAVRLADYSLAAIAAQADRFAFPEADRRSPRSTLALAAHLDAQGLALGLRRVAEQHGAGAAQAPFRSAAIAGGKIAALELADGTRIEGDLFLDCTGERAGLIGEALGAAWTSWRRWLPCDHARSRRESEPLAPPPYALHAAHETGWSATVPIGGARIVTELFASEAGAVPGDALRFEPGVRAAPWTANCIAIGGAAALIEPLLGTPLLAASNAVERVADLLPHSADCAIEANEYNRLTLLEAERLRDTVLALYRTNGRAGEAFWDAARGGDTPEPLARRLALYASRGDIRIEDGELFEAADWAMLLDGQGIHPRRHDPKASALPIEAIDAHLARLRERLIAEVRSMPTHGAVLAA